MKTIYLTLVLLSATTVLSSQNTTLTIGRGTDCFGRGACSISTDNSERYNTTLYQNAIGETILKIHRKKLSKEDEDRILGTPITAMNASILKFELIEAIELDSNIKPLTATKKSQQLSEFKAGIYPTSIQDEYIMVILKSQNSQY